ncbi:MAG: hypothetical protein HY791_38210 [Deltaproteobacteria bacterium]|nr:hypothetical protein [Deltaproteobacteria bacterium]
MIQPRFKVALAAALFSACADSPPDEMVAGGTGTISQAIQEGGPNPASVTLPLHNTGTCNLSYSVTHSTVDGAAWLTVSPTSGSVPALGTTNLSVDLDVVSQPLPAGTYTGTIRVAATCSISGLPAIGSPLVVPVNLTVTPLFARLGAATPINVDVTTLSDAWTPLPSAGAPSGREQGTAVWTNTYGVPATVVWGGNTNPGDADLGDGFLYDHVSSTWSPVSSTGAPAARRFHSAVWTGDEMIIWGGRTGPGVAFSDGVAYHPLTDTWSPISSIGAPSARSLHSAVWTGTEMIIWGGYSSGTTGLGTGARYNPSTDAWSNVSTTGAPSARGQHRAVWTGTHMLVFGGRNGLTGFGDGALYNPSTDSWSPMSSVGSPSPRVAFTMTWTGAKAVVYGGHIVGGATLSDGASYEPDRNRWRPIAPAPLAGRWGHTAEWTGNRALVFGGALAASSHGDGASYDPVSDTWSMLSAVGAPIGRVGHLSTWTGTEMLVFGGIGGVASDTNIPAGGVYR